MPRQDTLRSSLYGAALVLLMLGSGMVARADDTETDAAPLSADTIVERMEAANQQRADALRRYTGKRHYAADYRGFFGNRHAEMDVEVAYLAPDHKEFTVVSQSGSKALVNHVLLKLLESEKEALQESNRRRTALSPQNYDFTLLSVDPGPAGRLYVLQVEPKVNNKFLYRGKIWVDARDFAVAQIEASPAKNPSFWINHVEIKHDYIKVGDFWLPARNQSLSKVRLGGKATLDIQYTDYKVNEEPAPSPSR